MQTSSGPSKTDPPSLSGTLHYLLDGHSPMHRPSYRSVRDGRLSVGRPTMRVRNRTQVGFLYLRVRKHHFVRCVACHISPGQVPTPEQQNLS